MGDFEDVFGAGADADDIIDRYNKEYLRASNAEKANWFGRASNEENDLAIAKDEFEKWCRAQLAKGYERGPSFQNYEDLRDWDASNPASHIRRKSPRGGYQVFFIA